MLTSTDGVMWTERITGTFKSLNAAERPPAVLDRDGGTGEPRWYARHPDAVAFACLPGASARLSGRLDEGSLWSDVAYRPARPVDIRYSLGRFARRDVRRFWLYPLPAYPSSG